MSTQRTLVTTVALGILIGLVVYVYLQLRTSAARTPFVMAFIKDPSAHPELVTKAGTRCGSAPFIFPTTGMPGYLWGDLFEPGHPHQGVDIFAGTDVDETAVIAVYPGYLTRLADWKSSLIERIPDDPLQPGRQIWVYYTHLADPNGNSFISSDFPPGTSEQYIEAGTRLGYQGNYSGDPGNPVGVHLHISVVQDDGSGHFKNELDMQNTYDPSPYFGMRLNTKDNPDQIPVCESEK